VVSVSKWDPYYTKHILKVFYVVKGKSVPLQARGAQRVPES
jgi:hypothetical protein